MTTKAAVLLCVVAAFASACGSSPLPSQTGARSESVVASTSAQPGSKYCEAFEDLMRSQPEGAMNDMELAEAMHTYAESVERVAAMSSGDESVVLWELAAVARLVGDEPDNRKHSQRMGEMVVPVAPITLRATSSCAFEF